MKGWKIAVLALVVGVGTYFALELLLPHHKVEVKLEGLVPADSVFGGALKSPEEIAAGAATPGAAEAGSEATTPSGPAVNTDDATAAAETAAPAEPASEPAAATGSENATAAAEAAPEPAPAAPAETTAPASEPAAVAPPPAEPEPAPAPAAKPAAPSKPASKPSTSGTASKSSASKGPASPWWQTAGDGLHVVYVGSAAYKRAIVVMANAPLNAASAGKSLHVRDAAGKAVAGKWEANPNNATMLLFPVSRNGNYQVAIDATLADAQQRKLGKALKGVVLVQ